MPAKVPGISRALRHWPRRRPQSVTALTPTAIHQAFVSDHSAFSANLSPFRVCSFFAPSSRSLRYHLRFRFLRLSALLYYAFSPEQCIAAIVTLSRSSLHCASTPKGLLRLVLRCVCLQAERKPPQPSSPKYSLPSPPSLCCVCLQPQPTHTHNTESTQPSLSIPTTHSLLPLRCSPFFPTHSPIFLCCVSLIRNELTARAPHRPRLALLPAVGPRLFRARAVLR